VDSLRLARKTRKRARPPHPHSLGASARTRYPETQRGARMLPTSIPHLPTPGDLIASKYRVLDRLGAGGMGVVFEAVNVLTETPVAIKCLNPELAGTAWAIQRFQREARATGRIRHPNVVALHDYGEHEGCLYLVMELLKGASLRVHAVGRQFSAEETCRIMLPVMRGVAAAHAADVLHRDLKPDNVFLAASPDGLEPVPKVLDFGLARLRSEQDDKTVLSSVGAVLGTYQYMAPEQLRPKGELDARVDVYALGVMLYRLLTACMPYAADNPIDLALQILESEPALVTAHVPSLAAPLASVVARALKRDRELRYRSVEELAFALQPFATDTWFRGTGAHLAPPRAAPPSPSPPPLPAALRSGDVATKSGARLAGARTNPSSVAPARYVSAISSVSVRSPARNAASCEPAMSLKRRRPAALASPAPPRSFGVTEAFVAKNFRATLEARPKRPTALLVAIGGVAIALLALLVLVVRSGHAGGARKPAALDDTMPAAAATPAQPLVAPATTQRPATAQRTSTSQPVRAETARVANASDWTSGEDLAAEPMPPPAAEPPPRTALPNAVRRSSEHDVHAISR
jgi:serine/threonine protein kinase